MSEAAQRRLKAVGQQLAGPSSDDTSSRKDSIPPITRVAPGSDRPRVDKKVAIITGANSLLGIGRASAHQFAEHGAKAVYLCDYDDTHLEAHKRDINARWPAVQVHTRQFDAADEKAVKDVVDDALRRYGRLDVFFANAGVAGPQVLFTDYSAEDFDKILRVNALGPFLAAKHAAPAMQKTCPDKPAAGGSLIVTASVAGLRANAGSTAYSASKAAAVSIVQTVAFQLAGTGVRVNAICPGLIETGMTSAGLEVARARGKGAIIGQLNPMRRAGHADEIARVALFLGSDDSSYVNGQAWAVDGGMSAGHPFVPGRMN